MKTTRKREPDWRGVAFECEGKPVASIGFLILPDTYNPDAPRWQRRAGKTGIVTTRSKLADGFRRWRASSDKRKDGNTPLASMIAWLLRTEIGKEAPDA